MDYLEKEKSSATSASDNSDATTTASSSYYSHNTVIWIDILCRYPYFFYASVILNLFFLYLFADDVLFNLDYFLLLPSLYFFSNIFTLDYFLKSLLTSFNGFLFP
jgi:hypothetical protein